VQKRFEFEKTRHALNVEDLIFIDESGCHPGIGPLRGWSPKGVPLWGLEQSYARGQHISVVGAISLKGLIAKATVRGGVGSKQFRRFVEKQLVPVLRSATSSRTQARPFFFFPPIVPTSILLRQPGRR
jgi:hypothetical protein